MNKYLNKIINADCLDILKELPDKCIDLVITSPPYDNMRTYNNSLEWNFKIFQKIAEQLKRILKDGGVIVWIVSDATINGSETGTSFKQALYFKEIGLNLHDTMIWKKDSFSFPEEVRYPPTFEYMFICSSGPIKTFNPIKDRKNLHTYSKVHGTKRQKDGTLKQRTHKPQIGYYGVRHNVWEIPSEKRNDTGHPAVFPTRLASDHIESWSNEGELILDCFSGSGSTSISAHTLSRNFICIEKDKDYWQASVMRLEKHQRQMKLI